MSTYVQDGITYYKEPRDYLRAIEQRASDAFSAGVSAIKEDFGNMMNDGHVVVDPEIGGCCAMGAFNLGLGKPPRCSWQAAEQAIDSGIINGWDASNTENSCYGDQRLRDLYSEAFQIGAMLWEQFGETPR